MSRTCSGLRTGRDFHSHTARTKGRESYCRRLALSSKIHIRKRCPREVRTGVGKRLKDPRNLGGINTDSHDVSSDGSAEQRYVPNWVVFKLDPASAEQQG